MRKSSGISPPLCNFPLQSFSKLLVVRHDTDAEIYLCCLWDCNVHPSNETMPMQVFLKVYKSLSLQRAAGNRPTSSPFIGCQTRKLSINNGRLYSSRRLSPFGLSQGRHRRTVAPHSGRIHPSNAKFLALSLLICKNLQEKNKNTSTKELLCCNKGYTVCLRDTCNVSVCVRLHHGTDVVIAHTCQPPPPKKNFKIV